MAEQTTPTRPIPEPGKLKTSNRKLPVNAGDTPLRPGDIGNTSSFFNAHESEARVAAYCGFSDTGEFKRFVLSAYVTPHYVHFLNLRQSSPQNLSKRIALELLRDCPESDFASDDDPSLAWPLDKDDKSSKDMQLAGIAMQMLRSIRHRTLSQHLTDASCAKLRAKTKKSFPEVDIKNVFCPDLGPHGQESILEPANRCISILFYFAFASNPSNFSKKFEHAAWDQAKAITETYKPAWMQATKKRFPVKKPLPDETFSVHANDESTGHPPITVNLRWNYDSNAPDAAAYRDHVEAEGLEGQLPNMKTSMELHHHLNGPQFRDLVRVKFDMYNAQAQISSFTLIVKRPVDSSGKDMDFEEEEIEDKEVQPLETLRFNVLKDDWQEIQKVLWGPTRSVLFTITAKELGSGVLLEWAEPPKNLAQILQEKDGDVDGVHVPPEHDQFETNDGEHQEDQSQVDEIVGSMGHAKKEFDPLELFQGDKERMMRFYGGHDVTTPEGILAFQREVFQSSKIIGYQEPMNMDNSSRRFGSQKGLSAAMTEALELGKQEGFAASMNQDQESRSGRLSDELQYYALQQAMVGTQKQVGPPINPCVLVLGMTREDDKKGREAYRFTHIEGTDRLLFPYQANGVVWLIFRLLGYMPTPPDSPQEILDAAKRLSSVRTGCAFIGDQTGLGKTILLLATLIIAKYHAVKDDNGRRIYKMKFLAVPATLIPQWAEEIVDHWPGLNLVISYDDTGMPARLKKYFLSGTAVRQYPKKRRWPKSYEYLLDPYDERTGCTIFLTTYETHGNRTLTYQNKDDDHELFRSNFAGAFDLVAGDESQKIKDEETRRWKSTYALKGTFHVLITATAMLNKSTDLLAQARILYTSTWEIIANDPKAHQWILEHRGAVSFYEAAKDFKQDDTRLLGCIDPSNLAALLTCDSNTKIAEFFPMAENLFSLKRSNASRIPRDFDGKEHFEMKSIIKPHLLGTRSCTRRAEEEAEFQYLYRETCKRYIAVTRGSTKKKALFGKGKQAGNYGSGEMRELLIVTASTKMAVFNHLAKAMNRDTLVDTIQGQDERGWTAFDLVDFICMGTSQPKPVTAMGYVEFLTHGSPMLRALYFQIYNGEKYIGPKAEKKLLITEDIPLLARFYELALNLVFVRTRTYHSGLDAAGRSQLQKEFNDKTSTLRAMPLAYDVGGYGISLQKACDEVVVATPAKNHGSEIQAYGRPIRADQEEIVTVIKLFVTNSIHGYRESKKRDKVLVEYATRASDPRLRDAMVQLLNEGQEEVRTVQAAAEHQELRSQIVQEEKMAKDLRQLENDAFVVRDTIDIGNNIILNGPRKRVRTKFFKDIKWTNNGKSASEGTTKPSKSKSDQKKRDVKAAPVPKKSKTTKPAQQRSKTRGADDASDVDAELDFDEIGERDDDYVDDSGADSLESASENEEEGDNDFVPQDSTPSRKSQAKQARVLFLSENQLGEEERYLKSMLSLDGNKVYKLEDLKDENTLIRGLGLLYARRMGLKASKVPSIHIKYTHLGGELALSVDKTITFNESALAVLTAMFDGVKNTKRLAADEPSAKEDIQPEGPGASVAEQKALPGPMPEKNEFMVAQKGAVSSDADYENWTVKKLSDEYKKRDLPRPVPKNKAQFVQALRGKGSADPINLSELDQELYNLAVSPNTITQPEAGSSTSGPIRTRKRPRTGKSSSFGTSPVPAKKPRVSADQQPQPMGVGLKEHDNAASSSQQTKPSVRPTQGQGRYGSFSESEESTSWDS